MASIRPSGCRRSNSTPFRSIGQTPINRVGTAEILKLLLPIWTSKPETARRVLQRVSNVIDYGTAAGMRSGENPCRLAILGLPKQTDEPEHFAALPYADVPKFVAKLRNSNAAEITRLAFEFLILNASRSGEVRLAPKSEIRLRQGALDYSRGPDEGRPRARRASPRARSRS